MKALTWLRVQRSKTGLMAPWQLAVSFLMILPPSLSGQESMDHSDHSGHHMAVNPSGVVMNENRDRLPRGCPEISGDQALTIYAGRKYARDLPGIIFGMSEHEVQVEPCSRVEVTFVNEDSVRHQWMVHGLPKYLYPAGMFHIEANGGHTMTGTFIVPAEDQTYLVHCDMAQHMEKGMRGQLLVGSGSGDLWSVPGISANFYRSDYLPAFAPLLLVLVSASAFILSLWLAKRHS
ncbi:MAG: multicopper oxidase domain-containing protein [Gammaproteobacteria bacterium]|jgi:plastocyanin|nr:multicopper oxidase domain-containing protein [Gammaproteobacteria bacterium]